VGQKILLVCRSISMACAMVEDIVRVVAVSFQRTLIHCTRLHPVLAANLMACRKYGYGMTAL
jgi:hypothetical protein